MVVGFDEAVHNITEHAHRVLGDNMIVVVTADNGGSPWFGGSNYPLRGSKGTPYEGGHKVPAVLVDFTPDLHYLADDEVRAQRERETNRIGSEKRRLYHGMMHVSDWFPTLLGYSGVNVSGMGLDGKDFGEVLRRVPFVTPNITVTNITVSPNRASPSELRQLSPAQRFSDSPRDEMLYEFQPERESAFAQGVLAYRAGKYKLIRGIVRDEGYYFESPRDSLSHSQQSPLTALTEAAIRAGDWVFGTANYDMGRISTTHQILQDALSRDQVKGRAETLRLFDLESDPLETENLYHLPWAKDIVRELEGRLDQIERDRPPSQRACFEIDLHKHWRNTLIPGDCSMNPRIHRDQCLFAHPWILEVSLSRVYSTHYMNNLTVVCI